MGDTGDFTISIRRPGDPAPELPVGVSCTLEHVDYSSPTPFVAVSIGAFRRLLRAEEISVSDAGETYLRAEVVRALVAEADAFHARGRSH